MTSIVIRKMAMSTTATTTAMAATIDEAINNKRAARQLLCELAQAKG